MSISTSTLAKFISFGSVLFAVGCGGGNDGTGTASGQTQNTGGGAGAQTPGCETAPACGSCQVCYDTCVCLTGKNAECVAQCAGQGTPTPIGGGGAGGGTSVGTGGATTTPGSGGTTTVGAGGTTSVGAGGTTTVGAGGTTAPAGGGATSVGTGGTTAGTGGTTGAPAYQELTLTSDTFPVNPGEEIYRAQNFANPIGKDVDIIESESFMTPGSHHMFAFHDPSFNADSGVQTSSGIEFHPYIHTAQTPQQLMTYPAGIGRYLKAGEGIRLQVHYINTGSTALTASVSLRIRYVDTTQVQYHAAEVFLNNIGISVKPGISSATSTVAMPYAIKLLGAASHMHKRATLFDSKTNTGQEIYTTTQWDEPKASAFNPAMDIAQGGSISWTCTWNNTTGTTLSFGESAANNEMCIFSGVYYPAPNGAPISKQCLGAGSCF
jgi:hypothetical protein